MNPDAEAERQRTVTVTVRVVLFPFREDTFTATLHVPGLVVRTLDPDTRHTFLLDPTMVSDTFEPDPTGILAALAREAEVADFPTFNAIRAVGAAATAVSPPGWRDVVVVLPVGITTTDPGLVTVVVAGGTVTRTVTGGFWGGDVVVVVVVAVVVVEGAGRATVADTPSDAPNEFVADTTTTTDDAVTPVVDHLKRWAHEQRNIDAGLCVESDELLVASLTATTIDVGSRLPVTMASTVSVPSLDQSADTPATSGRLARKTFVGSKCLGDDPGAQSS